MNEPILFTHLGYLAVTVPLAVWVARTLHRNGRVFLVDSFRGNVELADSVNQLLVVGFYLMNLGFICLYIRNGARPTDLVGALEETIVKVGTVTLVLGVAHLFNIYVFSKMRKRALLSVMPPPLAPHVKLATPS
jgi:hypothetical protein